jgi:thioredoxin-like negative regulator of GroEL
MAAVAAGVWLLQRPVQAPPPEPRAAQGGADAVPAPPPVAAEAPLLAPPAFPPPTEVSTADSPPEAAEMPPVTARCPIADGSAPSGSRQVPPYWLAGASGYEDAMRRRRATAAPMVVYFFTDWCGYCKQIERELFSSSDVERYFSRATIRVRVNPEESASDKGVADRFGVTGYPSFYVLGAGGDRPLHCALFREGKTDPISANELERAIEDENKRVAKGLVYQGYQRREAGDLAGAETLLDQAVQSAPTEPDAWMQRAVTRERQGSLDGALSDYAVAAALRGDGSIHERAVYALFTAQRFDEAVACATDWLQREPTSAKAVGMRARAHRGRGDVGRYREDAARACALGDGGACAVSGGG